MQPAVEIDGEAYWDGGYSANPPLRQLVLETQAEDILLVRLLPDADSDAPYLPSGIAERIRTIAFNAPLLQEEASVDALRRSCAEQGAARSELCRKLAGLHMHSIAAQDAVEDLSHQSPLDTSRSLCLRLKERGRGAAAVWLRNWQAGHESQRLAHAC
jgi:NTE family protein